jgi:hypothetical protein
MSIRQASVIARQGLFSVDCGKKVIEIAVAAGWTRDGNEGGGEAEQCGLSGRS